MQDYRKKIYDKYASCIKGSGAAFDHAKAQQWSKTYESYLKGWLPENRDADILEVACGRGNLLNFLKELRYENLTGVDICAEQASLSKQVVDNIIETNALDFLKETENNFDMIIALDFIEHLTKDEILEFLELCFKKLKPSGRLILQTPNASSPFVAGTFYGDFTHETLLTPESLKSILKLSGFSNTKIRATGPVIHGFASAIRYVLWKIITSMTKLFNLIETGSIGSAVFTRVFLVSTEKYVK